MMSRATAGIIKGRVLFSTPGSENAVRLAMEKLILPELGHLVKELTISRGVGYKPRAMFRNIDHGHHANWHHHTGGGAIV